VALTAATLFIGKTFLWPRRHPRSSFRAAVRCCSPWEHRPFSVAIVLVASWAHGWINTAQAALQMEMRCAILRPPLTGRRPPRFAPSRYRVL
jgi:hypothetical protein